MAARGVLSFTQERNRWLFMMYYLLHKNVTNGFHGVLSFI